MDNNHKKLIEKQRFSANLNALLDHVGFPEKGRGRQAALAKQFDISQKGARKWLEAEAIPIMTRINEIVSAYRETGVTPDWLLLGDTNSPPWRSLSENSENLCEILPSNSCNISLTISENNRTDKTKGQKMLTTLLKFYGLHRNTSISTAINWLFAINEIETAEYKLLCINKAKNLLDEYAAEIVLESEKKQTSAAPEVQNQK